MTLMMTGAVTVDVLHIAVTVPVGVTATLGVLARVLLVALIAIAIPVVGLMPPVMAAPVMGALLSVARGFGLWLMARGGGMGLRFVLWFVLGLVIIVDGFADDGECCDAKESCCDGVGVVLRLGALSIVAVAGLSGGGRNTGEHEGCRNND